MKSFSFTAFDLGLGTGGTAIAIDGTEALESPRIPSELLQSIFRGVSFG